MARIVVIDDQEPIRRILKRVLEGAGHDVVEASDGNGGMRLLDDHAADLVITDIFMPGQDGIVTLGEIRRTFPETPVIVMSGGDSTGLLDLRRDAELLGAVRSLGKPFTAAQVLEAVAAALAGR